MHTPCEESSCQRDGQCFRSTRTTFHLTNDIVLQRGRLGKSSALAAFPNQDDQKDILSFCLSQRQLIQGLELNYQEPLFTSSKGWVDDLQTKPHITLQSRFYGQTCSNMFIFLKRLIPFFININPLQHDDLHTLSPWKFSCSLDLANKFL